MGKFKHVVLGAAVGTLFITLIPDDHYRIFRNNFYRPISRELNKTEVDLAKILRLSLEGMESTVKDYFK